MVLIISLILININVVYLLTLGKYHKVEISSDAIVFESKDFLVGDKMEFKFKTNSTCNNTINYAYYDDYNGAYSKYETYYSIKARKEKISYKNKNKQYEVKYFTIIKNSEELNGLDGDYLLIKFNCDNSVEIENINPSFSTWKIVLIIISCLIFIAGITIILILKFCKKDENISKGEIAIEKDNIDKDKNDNDNEKENEKN